MNTGRKWQQDRGGVVVEIEKAIIEFANREKKEAEISIEKEKNQVCINPDSYIAKEIKYQTALLHQIQSEIQGIKKKKEDRSPRFSRLKIFFRCKCR